MCRRRYRRQEDKKTKGDKGTQKKQRTVCAAHVLCACCRVHKAKGKTANQDKKGKKRGEERFVRRAQHARVLPYAQTKVRSKPTQVQQKGQQREKRHVRRALLRACCRVRRHAKRAVARSRFEASEWGISRLYLAFTVVLQRGSPIDLWYQRYITRDLDFTPFSNRNLTGSIEPRHLHAT